MLLQELRAGETPLDLLRYYAGHLDRSAVLLEREIASSKSKPKSKGSRSHSNLRDMQENAPSTDCLSSSEGMDDKSPVDQARRMMQNQRDAMEWMAVCQAQKLAIELAISLV